MDFVDKATLLSTRDCHIKVIPSDTLYSQHESAGCN